MMNAKEKEYMDYLIHNRNQLTEQNTRILEEVLRLQKKLDIAVKVLKEYADEGNWCDCLSWNGFMEDSEVVCNGQFGEKGFVPAQKSLREIDLVGTSAKEEV